MHRENRAVDEKPCQDLLKFEVVEES